MCVSLLLPVSSSLDGKITSFIHKKLYISTKPKISNLYQKLSSTLKSFLTSPEKDKLKMIVLSYSPVSVNNIKFIVQTSVVIVKELLRTLILLKITLLSNLMISDFNLKINRKFSFRNSILDSKCSVHILMF